MQKPFSVICIRPQSVRRNKFLDGFYIGTSMISGFAGKMCERISVKISFVIISRPPQMLFRQIAITLLTQVGGLVHVRRAGKVIPDIIIHPQHLRYDGSCVQILIGIQSVIGRPAIAGIIFIIARPQSNTGMLPEPADLISDFFFEGL